ncbi:MAG TPA: type 2 lanthipeptide synthetase LanM, partial [Ktedonosporobacter sp.]|nr:type 2 lanthipeptide synthetase LanM [Ktedonosporobacter sp.]
LQRYLDRLWIMAEHCPFMKHLIRAECADLLEGDIPYFTARPASQDIWTSRGECIAEFFPEASLDIVKDRITGLNEHDLAQQLWIIQASLTAVSMEGHTGSATRLTPPPTPIVWATPLRLQSAAQAIGNRLCALALHNEERVGWLGITLTNNIEWKIMPAETDFYSGLPGIAFFLAYLGSVTGQAHATQLAQSVARMLKQQLETPSRQSTAGIGAFAGWGAQLYLFSHLYSLWREQWLLDAAAQCVEQITPLIEQDTHLDIISGAAGCIAALLSLYNVAPSSDLMASALRCGEHLVTSLDLSADSDPVTTLRQKGVLTGYAHGASGMALSLLQLASLSREPSFQQAALVLLAFEHSLFSAQHQNWPDLRDISKYFPGDEAQRFMTAWCHGAPGIGMSRLAMLNYLDNSKIRQEIDAALHTTLKAGFGRNHSLCHGDLGNLELLLTATRHPGMAHYEPLLTRHTTRLLASGETSGWITGIPLGVETPGMMVGLSGIGYQLLRLSAPERVPNVLLLSPPVITELGQNSPIHKVRRRSFSPYPFLGAPSEV